LNVENRDLLAKVLSAVSGNSISINMRSWLKRLSVTPVSVVEKKDMGDLCFVRMRRLINYYTSNSPKHRVQELLVKSDAGAWNHCDDELPDIDISTALDGQGESTYQQLTIRKTSAKPPSIA
jgi:hypothetical protein